MKRYVRYYENKTDKNRTDEPEYMKNQMIVNHQSIRFLGEKLRNNPDFILEMLKND